VEAEIEKVRERRKRSQRLIRRTIMTRTQICRELLKNLKKPRREKSGQELLQKSCKEDQMSLERKRSNQLQEMILILEEEGLLMLEMLTT